MHTNRLQIHSASMTRQFEWNAKYFFGTEIEERECVRVSLPPEDSRGPTGSGAGAAKRGPLLAVGASHYLLHFLFRGPNRSRPILCRTFVPRMKIWFFVASHSMVLSATVTVRAVHGVLWLCALRSGGSFFIPKYILHLLDTHKNRVNGTYMCCFFLKGWAGSFV